MKKRMLSILLALVMCVSMLPMQVFAAQDDSVTVTLDPESKIFSKAETSALATSLMTLDSNGKVALKATNEVEWIDRLDLTGADYALDFYDYLVENSTEGGALRTTDVSEYAATTFAGKGEFTYTGDEAVDKRAALAAISDDMNANWNEASAYLSAAYYAFDRDHPEVFWLSGESMFSWEGGFSYSSDGTVTYEQTIYFVLRDLEEGYEFDIRDGRYLDENLNLDETWINDIDAEGQAIATEWSMAVRDIAQADSRESALFDLHYYLTTSNEYNTSADLSSADSVCWEYVTAIVGSEGTKGPVCEAYARAFKVVCDKAGIPCVLVDGYASPDGVKGEAHMWNYVQMDDGLWYAVDVTWDDPVVAGVSGAKSGYENENYFLVGAQTEIDGVTFEVSHPVSNAPSSSAPNFTNGPVLSDDAYVASEGGDTGDTGDSKEPRLMAYRVEGDGAGGWVDPGYGMEDAWYFNGTYLGTQAVFCFGTEDDYIELDMDNLWVSDEKAVELIYEGTNTAGSDVLTLNVYEFGNHTIYYEDDTGVVHKMPVYVYLPDVGYFSEPVMSEETYLHQFVLTETNRTYYVVSGVGDIISVELSEDDADLAEYLEITWKGNYASITFTENPPDMWMYPYLYVTVDRGEDYPDGWWAGMGLEVLVNGSGEGGGEVPEVPGEDESRLMFYHVGMNDEIGAWVDMGWGMKDAWYFDSFGCGQAVFCFGTEDGYIELDFDDLWVSDDKAVVLTYKGSTAAGSDVADVAVYQFGNYSIYYQDTDGTVYSMPVYVYLPDVGYFSEPVMSEEAYLNKFVLTETNRTVYLVSNKGNIMSIEVNDYFADCTEVTIYGNYAEITFTDVPDFTEKQLYLYVTIDRGEDYPDGWECGRGLSVVTGTDEGGDVEEPVEPEYPSDSGICGDNLYWYLEDGVLTIYGTGAMYDYTGIGTPWSNYSSYIYEVIVEEGVTTLGETAFAYLYDLTKATLPDSLVVIDRYAFVLCTALTEITIPANVALINSQSFTNCTALSEITFLGDAPQFNEEMYPGEDAFSNVTATVYYPADNTTWTADVMKNYGGSLTWVAVGGPVTPLTQIPAPTDLTWGRYYYRDYENDVLTYAEYPGMMSWRSGTFDYRHDIEIKVYRVSDDGTEDIEVFWNCWYCGRSDLEYNTDHDFSLSVLEELESGTYYFTAQAIGDGETTADSELVTSGTWTYTRPAERLSAPTGLAWDGFVATWDRVSHEDVGGYTIHVFWSADESGEDMKRVTGFVRYSCEGEMLSFVPNFDMGNGYYWFEVKAVSADMNTVLHSEYSELSKPVYFEFDFDLDENGVLTIRGNGVVAAYWIYDPTITKVVIEEGITSIPVETFYCCENLTEVIIPGSVTQIGAYAFAWCEALENITFTGDAPSIGEYAFANVTATVYYPADNTTWTEAVMQNYGGTLTWKPAGGADVELPVVAIYSAPVAAPENQISTFTVSDTNQTFYVVLRDGAGTLKEVFSEYDYLDKHMKCEISADGSYAAVTVARNTLSEWYELMVGITDNNGATSYYMLVLFLENDITGGWYGNMYWTLDKDGTLTVGGSGAMVMGWAENTNIEKVVIEEGITSIRENAFSNCTNLTEVIIPATVASIGRYAFQNCDGLESVAIPTSVAEIGEGAFYHCENLKDVALPACIGSVADWIFYKCTSLRDFAIPEGVTYIGEYAFAGCASLTEMTIPDSVETMGVYAFQNCTELKSVTLGSGLDAILADTFYDCESLTEIVIPENITSIETWAFAWCEALESVTFEGDAPDIGGYTFYGVTATCYYPAGNKTWTKDVRQNYGGNLTWVPMGEVVPEVIDSGYCGDDLTWELTDDGVLTISGTGAMYDYDARQDTTLPGWHEYAGSITSVCLSKEQTTIGENAFIDLTALTAITVPDSVESIGYQAFWGCESLEDISFGSGLKSIGEYVFLYCNALETVTFGMALESIGMYAFAWCESLAEVSIPDNVTSLGMGAFCGCPALTKVQLGSGVKTLDHFIFQDCSLLSEVVGLEHVTTINNYVFAGTALTEITIPSSVQTIGNWTFQSCESLTKVVFEGDAPSIGDYAFQSVTATCYYPADKDGWDAFLEQWDTNFGGNLTWKAIGGEEPEYPEDPEIVDSGYCGDDLTWELTDDGVLTISGTGAMYDWHDCEAPWYEYYGEIFSVVLPEGLTTIGTSAFFECYLTEVVIPDSVTEVGYHAFAYCGDMETAVLGSGVENIDKEAFFNCESLTEIAIPDNVVTIGENAFEYCIALEKVTLGSSLESVGKQAFYYCENLKEIVLPDSLITIGVYAFEWCFALEKVVLGSGVETIEAGAFSECEHLTEIVIPASVETIGDSAFGGCIGLTRITFEGDAPDIDEWAFDEVTATVYYPGGNATWTKAVMQNYGGELTWVAIGGEDPEVPNELAVTDLHFLRMPGSIVLEWTAPANAEEAGVEYYVVYYSTDGGETWEWYDFPSETYIDLSLPGGVYNAFKVETWLVGAEEAAAEVVANLTLTVTEKYLEAADVSIVYPASADEKYTVTVTGLTPNTEFTFEFGYNASIYKSGSSSDENGTAVFTLRNDSAVTKRLTNENSKYLIQELSGFYCGDSTMDYVTGSTAGYTVTTRGDWALVSDAVVGGGTEEPEQPADLAVSNLHFDYLGSGSLPYLYWTAPTGVEGNLRYNVYASTDGGQSWTMVSSTSQELISLTGLGAAVYTAFKVETKLDGKVVAECSAKLTLTVTRGEDLPAATVVFTEPEVEGEDYDIVVSGLTPRTWIRFTLKRTNGSGSSGSTSDAEGRYFDSESWDNMSKYLADETSAYLVQEYSGGSVSEDGLSAGYTVANRGGWTLLSDAMGGGSDEPEVPESGYGIEVWLDGPSLIATITGPADAEPGAIYTYYFYNTEDPSVSDGLGGMPIGAWQPFDFRPGTYNAWQVLRTEDGTVLGEGMLAKPIVSVADAFEHPAVTLTKGEYSADNGGYAYILGGLDLNRYTYTMDTETSGYYIYDTTIYTDEHAFDNGAVLYAQLNSDCEDCFLQELSCGLQVTLSGGEEPEEPVTRLMFCHVDWTEEGGLVERPEWGLSDGWNGGIDTSSTVRFYLVTGDERIPVELEDLRATGGVELRDDAGYVEIRAYEFGQHQIIYTDADGVEYSLPVTVGLPMVGFYKDKVASEENYLYGTFTVTEEDRTFYVVLREGVLTNVSLNDRLANIAELTVSKDRSYAAVTVTGVPDGGWYSMLVEFEAENWSGSWGVGLNIGDSRPHLMYRSFYWNENDEMVEEQWFQTEYHASIQTGMSARFYFGTEKDFVAVDPENLSVSGKGIHLEWVYTDDGLVDHVIIHTVDFGDYEIIYTTADGEKYTLPVTVGLPDIGFYSESVASEKSYLYEAFTVTAECNTFYLVPINGALLNVELLDELAGIATVTMGENGSYAAITVNGTPNGRWYNMRVEFTDSYGNNRTWNVGLELFDGNPHLMFRNMDFENGVLVEDNRFRTEWNTAIQSAMQARIYFGTEKDFVAVDPDSLRVSGNGITLRWVYAADGTVNYVWVETVAFGQYEVIYTHTDGKEYSIPVNVGLPPLGFYTESAASEKAYIDEFTVTEENNTVYLIPQGFKLISVELNGEFAKIATVEIAKDGSYAAVTVTGIPNGGWYNVTAVMERADGKQDKWGAGLRIVDGNPHLMFRGMDVDENGVWYENPNAAMEYQWKSGIGYGRVVKFYFGTPDSYVPVDVKDLTATAGVTLSVEQGQFVWMNAVAFGKQEIVYTDANGEKYSLPVVVSLPDLAFYNKPVASEENYIDEFKVTAENDTVYLVALNGKLTKVELVFDFAKIAEVEIAEDGSYAAITVTGTPNGNPYMAIASVETENGNVWNMYAHLRIIDGNPRLMFRDMDRDENGWYENPDWIMRDSMVISLDSASVCKFYFGTEGDCVAVDPDSLTASGDGIVLQWVYNNDGSVYYALVLGRAFGEYQIIYTDADGEKYTLPVKVSLPPLGFYTEPVASEAAYIEEFTVTDENDTFYLIAPGNMLTRVELNSSLAKIATVEIAEDGSYAAITVTGTPTVSWYGLTADFGNEYWSTTGIGAGLYITDGRTEEPEIDYAVTDLHFEEKNGMPYLCWTAPDGLDQDVRYVVMLSMSIGGRNQWLHLNSTDETWMDLTGVPSGSYTAAKVVTKSGDSSLGKTLAESVADLTLTVTEGENLPAATVVITPPETEGGDYTISIDGMTPDTYFSFAMRNTDGINSSEFLSDADGAYVHYVSYEQMQAYLKDTDSKYLLEEFSGAVSEDGTSADLTKQIRGGWFSIEDAVVGGGSKGNLMFRAADWTPETGWFDNPDYGMMSEWNCEIKSGILGKFLFVTDTECVELTIDQLTVSGNGVELGASFGFINMTSNDDGRYTVRYTHTDGVTYSFDVNVTLPNVAFYTQPVADGDYFVNVFTVTELGQMLCLIPSNGYKLIDISVSPELSAIAQFEFNVGENYVIMAITGVPADRWYDVEVTYGNETETRTTTVSVRLLNGMEPPVVTTFELIDQWTVFGGTGSRSVASFLISSEGLYGVEYMVLTYTGPDGISGSEQINIPECSYGLSVEGLPSGEYTVSVVAYDIYGAASEPASIVITVDNDPPAVPENVTAESDFEKIVLNWTMDATGDTSLYRIERDGVEISVVGAGVSSYTDNTAQPGVEYSYCVVAEDEVGNRAESAAVKAQRVKDDQAPEILDIWPTTEDNVTFCYNGTVALKLSDNWKLAKVEAFCGGELVYAAKMGYADGYLEFLWDVSKLSGEQTLDIAVTDAAGNVTERSVTVTVRPYSAPVIPGNLTAVAGFKTASLKWTYSGDLKTLKQFKVYSCDADYTNPVLVNNVKNYKYTVKNLEQGAHYFVVAAEDIYGNLSDFARVEVYLANEDNEAPVAVILPKDPMGVEGIAIDFSGVNSTDNDEITSYSWNFGDGTTGSGVNCSHAYSMPGSYTVTLTVTDRSGNKTVAEKEVTVLDVTGADATHSIVTVTVMDGYVEGTPAIANATVTIYDEAGFEITALTDANGKAELVVPNGVCNVAAAANGYTASGRKIVVQADETGRMDCTVYLAGSSVKTVDGSLTTHVMTYEEIVAAGIDTTDPANNHVVKHAFVLEFKPTPELAFEIPVVNYTNRNGDRVGIENQIIWYEFEVEDDDEDPGDGASPDWDHSIPMKVGVFPITEHFYLVIYGETHWLKEMFNVELLVINNSYAENITDCIAELELPEGLSLASMLVGGQSPVVSLGDIGHVGNTDGLPNQVSTNWYVRGDKEGEYTLTANVTGNFTQDLYNKTPFSTSFTTDAPIKVYAGSALKLFISAQDTAYYNTEYYVQFKLQNVSDRTLYNVSFGLTGAEQYRAEIQHRGKEGDVIKELDKLSEEHFGDAFYTVEEFRPGDAITVNFCTKTLFLNEEWEAFADKLEFINIAYKLQNVFVMTLEGSTTEIPYEVEILPVAKQSFAEWLWDQTKENVGDAIKDGAVGLIDATFFGGIPVTENVVKVFEYAMDEYEKATNTADSYMTITLERGAYFDTGASTWSGRSTQEGVRVYTDGKYEVAEDGSIRLYGDGKLYVERTGATVDENGNEIEPQINVTTSYVDGLGEVQEYTYSLVEEDGKSFVPDEDDLQLVVEEVYMEPPVGPGVTYKEEDGEPVINVEKPSSDELERVITFPFVLLSTTGNLVTDGSNVLWQLIDALGNLNPAGMYLDQNGNLTIDANAKPGTYTVVLSLIQALEGQRFIQEGAMLMNTEGEDDPVTSVSYTFTLTENPAEETDPVIVDLTAMEVSFDAEILMWTYFVIPDELLNDDGAKVLVTKNGAWGETTTEITMAELRANGPTSYGDYKVEQGIASGEMTREVTVRIVDGNGNYVSIRDYVSGNVDTKVVRTAADYAARVFEVGSARQKELVKAMLTYGGYSQNHFNVDAGNPVYNLLTEYGYEIPSLEDITADDIAQEMSKSAVSNGVTYSAQEAYLDSAIYHRVYFKLDAGEEISNFKFEIELIDVYGNLYTETVTATYDSVYDEYYVDIPDIAAAHLDHLYTVTVTNLTTGDTYEVTTSVLVWAKTVIARSYNVNQVNLAKAVYYYNQAANVFFGK